jgi:hypothetical protein
MANKITKREVINTMLADEVIKANEMYVAYLENELKLLDKKAQKKGKSDEELAEIDRLKGLVVATLEQISKGTVTEIQKANSELGTLSNQKVTSLVSALVKDGVVIKFTESRKSVFTLA